MPIEFKIEGMDELSKKLQTLTDGKAVNRRARSAARKAMQLVLFAAKVGASRIDDPDTRESIQENLVIRNGKSRDINTVRMRVGVLGGALVSNTPPTEAARTRAAILFTGALLSLVPQLHHQFHF